MSKTPTRRAPAVATRSSPRLVQRGTPDTERTSPRIIHTYTRRKPQPPPRRDSSVLSISSNFSDSLPTVEEVFSAIGKPLPPSVIDKINYHFRKLRKLVSNNNEQMFAVEAAAFQETLDAVRQYSNISCSSAIDHLFLLGLFGNGRKGGRQKWYIISACQHSRTRRPMCYLPHMLPQPRYVCHHYLSFFLTDFDIETVWLVAVTHFAPRALKSTFVEVWKKK